MDPKQTIQQIFTAIKQRDVEDLEENIQNLNDWLNKGGFVPNVEDKLLSADDVFWLGFSQKVSEDTFQDFLSLNLDLGKVFRFSQQV